MYFALGWLFFGLGVIGLLLPLLPTTPFMILALWAFSLSSQRFHDWLLNHRRFGPRLRQWRKHRVIPLSVKITAWSAMTASFAASAFLARLPGSMLLAIAAVMLVGGIYIAQCPSRPPDDAP